MRRLWIQSFENYSCVAANSHLVAISLCDHPFEWSPVKSYPTLLLDGKTGDVRGEFPSSYGRGMQTHFGIPKSVAFGPGETIALGYWIPRRPQQDRSYYSEDDWGTIVVWNWKTSQLVNVFQMGFPVTGLSYSPDGSFLVVGNCISKFWPDRYDLHLRTLDAETGKRIGFSYDGWGEIRKLAWYGSRSLAFASLWSAREEGNFGLINDVSSVHAKLLILRHSSSITSLGISVGKDLIATSDDLGIALWRPDGVRIYEKRLFAEPPIHIACSSKVVVWTTWQGISALSVVSKDLSHTPCPASELPYWKALGARSGQQYAAWSDDLTHLVLLCHPFGGPVMVSAWNGEDSIPLAL